LPVSTSIAIFFKRIIIECLGVAEGRLNELDNRAGFAQDIRDFGRFQIEAKEGQDMRKFKRGLVCIVLLCVAGVLAGCAQTAKTLFEDSFENVALGRYPGENGWQNLFSGRSGYVSDAVAHAGSKSFRLESRSVWSRTDYVPLAEIPDRLSYEASVYTDPTPGRSAFVGFVEAFANMGPVYHNFSINSGDGSTGKVRFHAIPSKPYIELCAFSVGSWVTVRADLNFTNLTADLWVDGEPVARDVAIAPKEFDDPSYGHVVLDKWGATEYNWAGSDTGVIYIDDVRIWAPK
jgi:hypothetical protein